jgi:hypothetical protein
VTEEWLARMRELARRDADELTPRPKYTVYGLAEPEVLPIGATEPAQEEDGEWGAIGLTYGDWASAEGPWVIVLSMPPAAAPSRPEDEQGDQQEELRRVIDTDRNRLARDAWVDDEEPDRPPDYLVSAVKANGRDEPALICLHGLVAVAQLRPGDANVTVLARGLDVAAIRLAKVTDLEPFLRGRDEMLGQMQAYELAPVLEPAEGIAAYRAFARAEVDSLLRIWAASEAGLVPRFRAGEEATTAALWRRMVHELSDRSGSGLSKAEERVNAFTNQLTALVQHARWFSQNERLRERAVDETLRHALLGEKVSSDQAQRAWDGYWSFQTSLVVQSATHEAIKAGARVGSELLREKWLNAWTKWSWSGQLTRAVTQR